MSFHRSSRRVQPTSLALETLEDRRVMATGITASLSGGVLNITGTVGNDLISLYQVKDQISVGGLTSVYAAKDVQSIVINGKSGDDFISLAGMGTSAKSVTILENGGNDTVRDAAGNDLFFSGGPHTVSVDAKGVKLDGAAPTWFDRNIHDAALRQLLKTDFADQTLDRKEMLGVFQQVEKAGVVSSVVLGDLKAVVNNASLFGSNNYVDVLASDVVLGNAANQFYAGASLGNLQAGDSAAKLDKLVGKWFLGADHPAATINGMTFQYTAAAGSLFGASGPQYSDVHQGYVGDCYFVATLGEIALRNPGAIRNMFIVNGDGTYTVRFFNNGKADFVTVDSQLPSYYGSFIFANMGQNIKSTSNVLWVALAEKAYAQINAAGWLRTGGLPGKGQNSYAGIEGGYMSDAVKQVTAQTAVNYAIPATSDSFVYAFNSGKLIGFGSKSNPANASVVGGHQYVVVGYDAAAHTVTLFNPWGLNNGQAPGLVKLSWSEVVANFDYWTVA